MQRYNFQFTGQRFYRIRGGGLAGQVRDVAYQATTTDFWGSLDGRRRSLDVACWAARSTAARPSPARSRPVSHGCPSARFRGVNVLNTRERRDADRRRRGVGPVVERAAARSPPRQVPDARRGRSGPRGLREAVLRWANSTMTTNGHSRERRLSVVVLVAVERRRRRGRRICRPRRGRRRPTRRRAHRRAGAAQAAAGAGPAQDAMPLPEPDRRGRRATGTSRRGRPRSACFARARRRARRRPRGPATRHYGFAGHERHDDWLGTSTGVRRRWVAADRLRRAQREVRRPDRLGVGGASTADFAGVDVGRRSSSRLRAGSSGAPAGSTCPRGATRRCCRRRRSPT